LRPEVDWLKRIAAMVRLEAITLGGGGRVFEEACTASLGTAVDVLLAQISDRRSAVVKQVSHLLVTLARDATKSFAQYVDHFVMALLKTTVVTVGVIADSGNACIRGIIEHCHAPKLVQKFTDAVVSERAPKMRGYIVEYLSIILKTWKLSNRHIEAIGRALHVTLSDADATVRSNSKACFEILSVTSPTTSGELLTRVNSKVARSLSNLTNESESEETSSFDRRNRSEVLSSVAPSRVAPVASTATKPPTPAPTEVQDVASAVMFAERVDRAAERASRAEASSRLRAALDDADVRTHGARAAQFEAQVTLHAARIAELLLGYVSDSNALVVNPALESIATLVYIASEDLNQVMPDLCLGVFECLTDHRESTRSLSSEALTAIGDVHKPNALLPSLLRSLHLASTAKTKTGVLEFALYVLSGRGGGVDEVVHTPATVSADLESWIDLVIEFACDVNEPLAKAAGSNLAAIHAHVDGAIVPRRLLATSEYTRVRFMEAIERRVPKLAEMLSPFLEAPPSPPSLAVKETTRDIGYDSLDEQHGYEDQNTTSLNRSYENMRIEASAGKSRNVGVGERIVEAMEGLRDENIETVVHSLRTIASSAQDSFSHFKPYMPLLVPTVCSAMDDENDLIAAHAYAALRAIFRHREIDTEDAFTALVPLVNTYSASVAPLLCAEMIIETADVSDVKSSLPLLLPSVAGACASKIAAIRQRALRVLGVCQRTFGAQWLLPYVEVLSVTHRAVLAHYARH
jgi:CLIP-associating protein 1/2